MQAVVYYAPGDIRVEERPEPTPTPDNLIVQVHDCAICGSDLKLATVGNPRYHPRASSATRWWGTSSTWVTS